MERQEALLKLSELIGKDLRFFADKYQVTVFKEGKPNKGWAGHVLECHLNLPINSSQSPNFGSCCSSEHKKVVPLKYSLRSMVTLLELLVSQRSTDRSMIVSMIDPLSIFRKCSVESVKISHLLFL